MKRKRNLLIGTSLLALIVACGVGQSVVEDAAQEQQAAAMESGGAGMAPMFEVDPLWPKNLPNHWLMGPTIGVDVDSRDHIWVVHRNTPDNFLGANRDRPGAGSTPGRVLRPRSTRPRVRPGRQPRLQLRRPE